MSESNQAAWDSLPRFIEIDDPQLVTRLRFVAKARATANSRYSIDGLHIRGHGTDRHFVEATDGRRLHGALLPDRGGRWMLRDGIYRVLSVTSKRVHLVSGVEATFPPTDDVRPAEEHRRNYTTPVHLIETARMPSIFATFLREQFGRYVNGKYIDDLLLACERVHAVVGDTSNEKRESGPVEIRLGKPGPDCPMWALLMPLNVEQPTFADEIESKREAA